jgi:predicted glutamine amidotransferase
LEKFSAMAEKSKAFDGDWQGDGWGFSWVDEKNQWQLYRSLKPVWQDAKTFETFPSASIFTIHARSASFPQHKNNLEYNQPYINESYSYVFNGLLKGVTLSLPGNVGAQKIWLLLNNYLKKMSLTQALYKTNDILKNNSRRIQALNIGVAGKNTISAYCFYSQHPKYYSLHYLDNPDLKIIVSEPIEGFSFKPLLTNSLITL